REQSPTPLRDEVRNHAELIVGEGARLDAAEYESAVLEQLGAGLGESGRDLGGVAHVQTQELVLRGAQQGYDPKAGVALHRPSQEFHFPARLALEIENALGAI